MGSGKEIEQLRCMLSKGMDVSFPSEIRRKRKTKLCERCLSVPFISTHDGWWNVWMAFT